MLYNIIIYFAELLCVLGDFEEIPQRNCHVTSEVRTVNAMDDVTCED